MPPSLDFAFPRGSQKRLALSCGDAYTAAASFTLRRGKLVLNAFEELRGEPGAQGSISWAERAAAALSTWASTGKFSGPCVVSLGSPHTLVKCIHTSLVDKASRAGIIAFEAQQAIPCALDDLVLDHYVLDENSEEMRALLGVAKRAETEAFGAAATAAGFPVEHISPACLALWHAVHYNYPELAGAALVISLSPRATSLVFVDGNRFSTRSFPLCVPATGVDDGAGVSGPSATTGKVADRIAPPAPGNDEPVQSEGRPATVTQFTCRLSFEIERTIANYLSGKETRKPETFLLTGRGAQHDALPAYLADRFECRVVRYDTMRRVEATGAPMNQHRERMELPAELVGLAISAGKVGSPSLNLLPSTRKAELRTSRRRRLLLSVIAFIVAALGPVAIYFQVDAQRRLRDSGETEARLKPMRELARKNAAALRELQERQGQLRLLQATADSRLKWIRLLGDLQIRLGEVEDVWLDRLQVRAAVKGDKEASGPLRLRLGGRVLDTENPSAKASDRSYARVKDLFQRFRRSAFVEAVVEEHFDHSRPGLLSFDCTLVLHPWREGRWGQ